MLNELDTLRKWGESVKPSASQKKHARAVLSAAISEQSQSRSKVGWRGLRRPIVLASAALVLGAATAAAAIYQFSPEPALELEGRSLVQGSLERERVVTSADLIWTAYTYLTDDDLLCFDFDATNASTTEPLGSIGSCAAHRGPAVLSGVVGGLSVENSYRQIMAGIAPVDAATARTTADSGASLTDTITNGVWVFVPNEPQDRWVIEALDENGEIIETLVLIDGELAPHEQD